MVKFVWLDVDGGRVPVNPDQVRYLRRTRAGQTALVFSALPGGYDELVLEMSAEAAVAALEGRGGRKASDEERAVRAVDSAPQFEHAVCACGARRPPGPHHAVTCASFFPKRLPFHTDTP